jgi:23S rRNA pseudouridine1911/1915/1917 synthase
MFLPIVDISAAGTRLDVFLSRQVVGLSRRAAQAAIAAGEVRVNGHRTRKGNALREGDRVELADAVIAPAILSANAELPISILYEDDAMVAVDKPAGVPSHALATDETGTVANLLLARYPEMRAIGAPPLEAGLVHRLDTQTSGVLLAARTAPAYRSLRKQFECHEVQKEYLAVVRGDLAATGQIRSRLAHDRRDRRRMRLVRDVNQRDSGRPAQTFYRPRERFGSETLVCVVIQTGVMHQIRVHLASIGHPVVGDALYGEAGTPAARHLLHASRLVVTHPVNGAPVVLVSPLAADMEAHLSELRRGREIRQTGRAGRSRR